MTAGDDLHVLETLRQMAWERAKGELQSILYTYWYGEKIPDDFEKVEKGIKDFIAFMENETSLG